MTYLVEINGGMLGVSQLRIVDDKFIERRQWRKIATKGGKEVLIDEHGYVEAIVVDTVLDVTVKLTEETRGINYL